MTFSQWEREARGPARGRCPPIGCSAHRPVANGARLAPGHQEPRCQSRARFNPGGAAAPPGRGGGAGRWPLRAAAPGTRGWEDRPGRLRLRLEGRAHSRPRGAPSAPAAGPGGLRVEGRGQSGRPEAFLQGRVEAGRRASLLGSSRLAARRRCPGARAGRSPAAAAAKGGARRAGAVRLGGRGEKPGTPPQPPPAPGKTPPSGEGSEECGLSGGRGQRAAASPFGGGAGLSRKGRGEKWVRVALAPAKCQAQGSAAGLELPGRLVLAGARRLSLHGLAKGGRLPSPSSMFETTKRRNVFHSRRQNELK